VSGYFPTFLTPAVIAQLGERKTEDLKVSGSIPDCGKLFFGFCKIFSFSEFRNNEKKLKTVILKSAAVPILLFRGINAVW
jgi:hypothetical protein